MCETKLPYIEAYLSLSVTVLILRPDGHRCGWQEPTWAKGSLSLPGSNICPRVCDVCAHAHAYVYMPAHHVSAISGSLLPSWSPHCGSQSVCSSIGTTQLTAATVAFQLAAAKSHYSSLCLPESLGGSTHAYTPSFVDLTTLVQVQIRKTLPLAS